MLFFKTKCKINYKEYSYTGTNAISGIEVAEVLKQNPNHEDAKYNLEYLKRLAQQQQSEKNDEKIVFEKEIEGNSEAKENMLKTFLFRIR